MDIMPVKTNIYKFDIPEKLFEELYSKADILYFLIDLDFNIISCNVTALETIDDDKNDLTGKNFLQFIPERDQKDMKGLLNLCLILMRKDLLLII